MMYGYGFSHSNGYGFMKGGMIFMMFLGLIIIATVIYFVIKKSNSQTYGNVLAYNKTNDGRAMEVLNEKFANGEISEVEYTSKKKLISGR